MYIYIPLCRYWIALYRYVLVFIVPHVDIELEDNKQFISNIPRIWEAFGDNAKSIANIYTILFYRGWSEEVDTVTVLSSIKSKTSYVHRVISFFSFTLYQ